MELTTVVNIKKGVAYDVYIGRGDTFGNPWSIGRLSRPEVLEKFKQYFYKRIEVDENFARQVHSLRGKILGCYCKPLPCHGDIIAEYVNERIY